MDAFGHRISSGYIDVWSVYITIYELDQCKLLLLLISPRTFCD